MAESGVSAGAAAPEKTWTEHEAERIEVDDTNLAEDLDDTIGESSYATSLASSVVNYPIEHGRRYHAFRHGKYSRPNDEKEMERLMLMHNVMTRLIGGLYSAPIDKAKTRRILDIGTGNGIWAISIAEEFPEATVIGNDLSANQVGFAPPNVKFEVDDVEDPWVHTTKFDWIFSRYMAASIHDWPKLMSQIYENLNPGGYAEFQDFNLTYYSEDGSLTEEHALRQWIKTLTGAADSLGRDSNPGSKLEGWARDAGFQGVTARRYRVPIGPWARDPLLKEVGTWNLMQVLNGLDGLSMRLYTTVLGWEEKEVWALLDRVRTDLANPSVHALFEFHVVYGQKPE
ncbi:S-adenosyl-L-methionine-dependent methyltransferase [Corynascus similis CBS 632.67]